MVIIVTLQQIIDERISFLKEQINPENKPQVNKTLQLQIDAIRSQQMIWRKLNLSFYKRRLSQRTTKMSMNPIGCLQSLTAWNGYSGR